MIDMCLKSNYIVKRDDSVVGVLDLPLGMEFVDCKSIKWGKFKKDFQIAQKAYDRYEDAKGKYLNLNPKVQLKYLSPNPNV
jgi:hypothetical protein